MTDQTTTPNFSEAPASWNTRYISPDGFSCQITLRGENGKEVLEKAKSAITWLQEQGCQPYGNYQSNNGNGKSNHDDHASSWCPIHNVEMKRWEKNGKAWYSHKTNDGWCSGNVKNGN